MTIYSLAMTTGIRGKAFPKRAGVKGMGAWCICMRGTSFPLAVIYQNPSLCFVVTTYCAISITY